MTGHGQQRWPLWRRVRCVDCGHPLVPDPTGPMRGYTCRCGVHRDAGALETRVLTACWAAETARTGGRVRPYVLAAAWNRSTAATRAASLAAVTVLVSSTAPAPIEVLHLPTAAPPSRAIRQSAARRPLHPLSAPKGTSCRATGLRSAPRRRPRTAPQPG